jgi:RNA polymerase sigma factor (sigma-70 family)
MNDFGCIDNNFIKSNEGLIKIALNKYLYCSNINDDIFQEARIWLCEAKNKYDKKRGSAWTTFAKYYIRQSYLNYVRKSKKLKRCPESAGYSNVGLEAINEDDLYKICNDSFNETEERVILYDMALDCLPEGRNKEIVILVTLGFTYDEIRIRYNNISRERIRQIYHRQIQIIQNKLCKENNGKNII